MTDNKNLLLHYLDKYRTDPDGAKWRAAIVAMFDEREADAERYRWLASDIDGNAQDDLIRWLNGHVVPKEDIDAAIDAARAKEMT